MDGKFQTHPHSSASPNQPARFARASQFADGCDDPIFLEECWILGVRAAAENQHRRRQLKADQANQTQASRKLHNLETHRFMEDRQRALESALADRAAAIVDRYDATASQNWTPQDWSPEDRLAQSWIPQGWTPSHMPRLEPPQQPRRFTELCDNAMTAQRARSLLEVTPSSTREQVRSAYRRMVGQWHPDRLQSTTEAVRIHATQHMALLNEAYRLLCSAELEQAA